MTNAKKTKKKSHYKRKLISDILSNKATPAPRDVAKLMTLSIEELEKLNK